MHPLVLLLHLAAAVMLLLWAVRMVRTGMERALGPALRDGLSRAGDSALGIAGVGVGLAVLLQSATAVALLSAGFVASGLLGARAAFAAVIGADLGSALVVRVLAFDLSGLVPVLLLVGAVLFLKFETRGVRQLGRIILGIGFVLLSLQMIAEATVPLRDSQTLPGVIQFFRNDPLTAFVVAALVTWAMHSSVAMVLLLAALAQTGVLPAAAAVPMVLGANFGAGLIAVWLARSMPVAAQRVLLGNMLLRGGCAAISVLAFVLLAPSTDALGGRVESQIVHLHLIFNLAVVVLGLPLLRPLLHLAGLMLPEPQLAVNQTRPRRTALDRKVLDQPALALASAKRELLLMGETVEEMFTPVMDVLAHADAGRIMALKQLDGDVNARHTAIKLYIAEVNRNDLGKAEIRHGMELTDFAIKLEHVGDIVAKTLLPLAEEKQALGLRFSDAGWSEMRGLHDRVRANLQLALNVLVSGDAGSALALMREKELLRTLERQSHERHLERLAQGVADSLATSNLHLEVVHAFKEINSLLVTVAVPILSERGMILNSRLAPGTAQPQQD
jgi:phosphate:Na+ symporter